MKQSFVLSFSLLLLSLSDATEFVSPSQPPVLSPASVVPLSQPPVLSLTPEPSSSYDCSTVIYGMLDCLSFLSVGSTDLSPTKSGCDGVDGVFEYNPKCFCVAMESSRKMGFELINSRTLAMLSVCNIHTDPHCDIASSPAASASSMFTVSPAEPPTTSPSSTLSPAISPSSPAVTPSSPAVTPSSPVVTHPTTVITASSPAITHSSPSMTASSPSMTAPSPSKSGTGNLLVSKLFLSVVIVSSFVTF